MGMPSGLMPPARLIGVNGVDLALYEAGPRSALPIVFLHGFPELAFSWRYQFQAIAAAGWRAIALDQRGYGLSSRPPDVDLYDIIHLVGDVIGLLDFLEAPRAVLCGHDWGSTVAWQSALRHPDRISGVISVTNPFRPRLRVEPLESLRAQFGEAMYVLQFQEPGFAERILEADMVRTLSYFLRRPDRRDATGALGQPPFAFLREIERYDWRSDPRPRFLTREDFDVHVEVFRRTGFAGALNWYRNLARNWSLSEDLAQEIAAPCLVILAARDLALQPASAIGMEAHVPDLERVVIEAGHWTQQERPRDVSDLILEWLDRRAACLGAPPRRKR